MRSGLRLLPAHGFILQTNHESRYTHKHMYIYITLMKLTSHVTKTKAINLSVPQRCSEPHNCYIFNYITVILLNPVPSFYRCL